MSKRIVKSIIALFFVAVGLSAAQLICSGSFIASFGEKAQKWLPICIFCVLGAGFGVFGYVIAPRLVKAYHFVTGSIMRRFTDMPLSVIFVGVIGLILGLLVAFLLSTFLLNIEPHFIGIILAVSAYLIFGTLGWLIPTKRSKEIVLPSWFRLGEKGGRTVAAPKVLDTSAIIDGRFFDVYKTGIIEGIVMIPQFVLDELRHIADSTDSVKRVRGRRGLDMLQDIQNSAAVQSIAVYSRDYPDIAEVDAKLLRFASEHHAMIVTTDYNLNKVATVQKVPVFNINDLANALRSSVAAGEDVVVDIVKEGKDILIKSTEGRQIKITQNNNELKASETLEFLNYTENKKYKLHDLGEDLKADKNLKYVYEIFKSIIEKLNPVDEQNSFPNF